MLRFKKRNHTSSSLRSVQILRYNIIGKIICPREFILSKRKELREKVHLTLQKVVRQSERNVVSKKKKSKIKTVSAYKILMSQTKNGDIELMTSNQNTDREDIKKSSPGPFGRSHSSEKYANNILIFQSKARSVKQRWRGVFIGLSKTETLILHFIRTSFHLLFYLSRSW